MWMRLGEVVAMNTESCKEVMVFLLMSQLSERLHKTKANMPMPIRYAVTSELIQMQQLNLRCEVICLYRHTWWANHSARIRMYHPPIFSLFLSLEPLAYYDFTLQFIQRYLYCIYIVFLFNVSLSTQAVCLLKLCWPSQFSLSQCDTIFSTALHTRSGLG